MISGKIKNIKPNGNNPYGFILPDVSINGQTEDVFFWINDVNGTLPSNLSVGDILQFHPENRVTKNGNVRLIARQVQYIKLVNTLVQLPVTSTKKLKDKISNFLDKIEFVTNSFEFEGLVFTLLRLIGINKICQYAQQNNAGAADGVFILGNVAVLYDCTLRNPYSPHKDLQIINYKNQLKLSSSITINEIRSSGKVIKKTFVIPKKREVWIITRNKTSIIQKADNTNNICVREVSVKSLIDVYNKKLESQIFGKLDIN